MALTLKCDTHACVDVAGAYIRKMPGVDFLVKLIGYLVRFKILFLAQAGGPVQQLADYKALLGSIVESRMLSNAGKGPSTFLSSMKLLDAPLTGTAVVKEVPVASPSTSDAASPSSSSLSTSSSPVDMLPSNSLASPTVDTLAPSSGGAVTRVVGLSRLESFTEMLRAPVKLVSFLSLFMRSFEQFSSDGGYLARYVFKQWDKDRLTHEYKKWKSLSLTCLTLVEISFLVEFIRQRYAARAAAARKENGNGASTTKAVAPFKYRFQTLAAGVRISTKEAINSLIVTVRAVCDMYIYYRWVPSWQPPEFWQYSAGIVSAVLGIWLVLEETINDVAKSRAAKTVGSTRTAQGAMAAAAKDDDVSASELRRHYLEKKAS